MASAKNYCGQCGTSATLLCGSRKSIKYCDRDCQKSDWRLHKRLCKTVADFKTPPGPNMRRIIILPVDDDKPYFAWLPIYSATTDEGHDSVLQRTDLKCSIVAGPAHSGAKDYDDRAGFERSDYKDVFGPGSIATGELNIVLGSFSFGTGKNLDHSIKMLRALAIDGSIPDNLFNSSALSSILSHGLQSSTSVREV